MNIKITLAAASMTAILSATACQQESNNTAVVVTPSANTATVNTANSAAAPVPAAPVSASASTPTEAYKAAYMARKNKDIPTLKSLMSKDILEFFELVGQDEKKSVDDVLRELAERPQADTAEARNEKINGDKATIEYLDENGKWRPMDFIKEGGVWKLTLDVGDTDQPVTENSNKK